MYEICRLQTADLHRISTSITLIELTVLKQANLSALQANRRVIQANWSAKCNLQSANVIQRGKQSFDQLLSSLLITLRSSFKELFDVFKRLVVDNITLAKFYSRPLQKNVWFVIELNFFEPSRLYSMWWVCCPVSDHFSLKLLYLPLLVRRRSEIWPWDNTFTL